MENYFVRESLYNLVELSLLARIYEEQCLPSAQSRALHQDSLAQTLLKMKATEKNGQLRVVIFGADPIAFHWQFQGQLLAHWIHPDHRGHGVEALLSGI